MFLKIKRHRCCVSFRAIVGAIFYLFGKWGAGEKTVKTAGRIAAGGRRRRQVNTGKTIIYGLKRFYLLCCSRRGAAAAEQ